MSSGGGVDVGAAARQALEEVFREQWGRIVASIIGSTGDWSLAEEAAADALAEALQRWPADGVPDRPGAWLTTVARRRAIDRLRAGGAEQSRLVQLARLVAEAEAEASSGAGDDRLRLIFTCCHPALALEARVALTLRTLAWLTVAEIARAFLVPEATMARRITRAKEKIRAAAIPYRVPTGDLLGERLAGVLAVVYLSAIVEALPPVHRAGPYQLQACIAACHARAVDVAATDWTEVAGLFRRLAALAPSPVVELNRAVAVAMADGPEAGLHLVDALAASGRLDAYYLLHATRADLLRRLGEAPAAAAAYERALELAPTEPERRFLRRRLGEVAPRCFPRR